MSCTSELASEELEITSQQAEEQKLMQLSKAWSDSVVAGNIEATIDFWADDAVLMAPGQPPIRGKEAIRDYVIAAEEIPGFEIRWAPVEAHASSSLDLGYMIEQNWITVPDSTGKLVTEHNKGVTVWRKEPDGSWKNVIDMWNADPSENK